MQLFEKKKKRKKKKYIPVYLEEETLSWGFGDSQFGVSFIPQRRIRIIEEDDLL